MGLLLGCMVKMGYPYRMHLEDSLMMNAREYLGDVCGVLELEAQ